MTLPRAPPRRLASDEGHPSPLLPDPRQGSPRDDCRRGTTGGMRRSTSTSAGSPHAGLHQNGTEFEIALDFLDDALVVQSGDGRTESFSLAGGLPVAGFDARSARRAPQPWLDVAIQEQPFGVPMKTPFREDTEHASWDHDARRALRTHPRLVGLRPRGVQRLVQRQDEPGALLLARLRSRVTRFSGRPASQARAPIPSRVRPTPTRSSRSASGPVTTTSRMPPTTPTPRRSPKASATSRSPSARGFPTGSRVVARHPPLRGRCGRPSDPRRTLLAFLRERLRGRSPPRRLGHDRVHLERLPLA